MEFEEAEHTEIPVAKETSDSMNSRHAMELMQLRKSSEKIRCSFPKKDKAGRARAAEEALEREREMLKRHAIEREEMGFPENAHVNGKSDDPSSGSSRGDQLNDNAVPNKESKAARRRRKRAEQEREAQARIEKEKSEMGPSERFKESEAIASQLGPRSLQIHAISADGHCLYNAVAHQMKLNSLESEISPTVDSLRGATADYLLAHKDEHIPFLDEVNGDEKKFQSYCEALRSEVVWGGQVEVKVMAEILNVIIEVYAAGMPVVRMGHNKNPKSVFMISYHRHYFGLGEHYNSIVPQS